MPEVDKRNQRASRLGFGIYVAGAGLALVAAGVGWRLLEPPLLASRLPLVLTIVAYVVPLALMGIGVGVGWRAGRGAVMGVIALIACLLLSPMLFDAVADLSVGGLHQNAIVLSAYECDVLTTEFEAKRELTCVELLWTQRNGRPMRSRFIVADEMLESSTLVRGTCVDVEIWTNTERLVLLEEVPPFECFGTTRPEEVL